MRSFPLRLAAVLLMLGLLAPGIPVAQNEPQAGHVRLAAQALRLQVNDYSTRWQFKLHVTVSAPDEAALADCPEAILQLSNPEGRYVELLPRKAEVFPKRFKAANARLQFRAVEDSAARDQSNLPDGFCQTAGPYRFMLRLGGAKYAGEFSFAEPLALQALQPQDGGTLEPVRNFCMASELPLQITTEPSSFGPVYYKRQDLQNFVYQLANIEDSLTSGSYHPPVESPQYVLQVRVGDATGRMELVDPSRYIRGHQPFLIRSDHTQTPLEFQPQELAGHKAVLVDFVRTETPDPNAGFSGPGQPGEGWSGQFGIQDRVLYALYIDTPPAPGELVRTAGDAVIEEEQAADSPQPWRQ